MKPPGEVLDMKPRLHALLVVLLSGAAVAPACAIDPPTVQGHLEYGKQRYELRHAQAVRSPDDPKRLWIVLTTAGISVKDAADGSRMLELAMSGKLRGVRLHVDAAKPNPGHLQGALLLSKDESPGGEIVFGAGAEKYWERLTVGGNRVVGKVRYAREATASGSPAWAFEVSFSAPIFNAR